jgi:arylsulfatase A-like enzyme
MLTAQTPKNVIVLLLDSLNRHELGAYGGTSFDTPNIDRLAARSLKFTNHHTGSLPCIPARHDILVGAWDFLWKPWGSIEIWEEAITVALRRAGVVTNLITDHPHLFEVGGENFHTDFTAWSYERGHESDAWKTRPDASWIGAPTFGRGHTHYDTSRGWFKGESDYPGPRTMQAATKWLIEDSPHHRTNGERFMLFVDEFDPHEPFDTPEEWAMRYDDTWEGQHMIWPPYAVNAQADGVITNREAHQIRSQYGSKLSMIDHWLGKVLDALDTTNAWADTAVILCTDHGHYLGDIDEKGRDVWGKPSVPVHKPLGHIPLIVAWPGAAPTNIDALTTSTDIHATIADVFGATINHRTHGSSLVPLIKGATKSVRDWLLTGVWGREVQLVTDQWRYTRGPVGANTPCGPTGGAPCRFPSIQICVCQCPMSGRSSTKCPAQRFLLFASPSKKVTSCRFGRWAKISDTCCLTAAKMLLSNSIELTAKPSATQQSYCEKRSTVLMHHKII